MEAISHVCDIGRCPYAVRTTQVSICCDTPRVVRPECFPDIAVVLIQTLFQMLHSALDHVIDNLLSQLAALVEEGQTGKAISDMLFCGESMEGDNYQNI